MSVIKDVVLVLLGGSTSEHSRGDAECCCGSFAPPPGARPLSGGDSGGWWGAGVRGARCRLCQPAAKKTEEGKDNLYLMMMMTMTMINMMMKLPVCLQKRQLCAVQYPALTVTAEETINVSGAGDRC